MVVVQSIPFQILLMAILLRRRILPPPFQSTASTLTTIQTFRIYPFDNLPEHPLPCQPSFPPLHPLSLQQILPPSRRLSVHPTIIQSGSTPLKDVHIPVIHPMNIMKHSRIIYLVPKRNVVLHGLGQRRRKLGIVCKINWLPFLRGI